MDTEKKILTAFAPTVPMWEVWYDDEKNQLYTQPVIAIALVETYGETYLEFQSAFQGGGIVNPGKPVSRDNPSFLGYAYDEKPRRERWERMINRSKARMVKNEKEWEAEWEAEEKAKMRVAN